MVIAYEYIEDIPEGGKEWEEEQGCTMGVLIIKHIKRGGTPPHIKKQKEEYINYLLRNYPEKNSNCGENNSPPFSKPVSVLLVWKGPDHKI